MVPTGSPLAQYWHISSRWPSSPGMLIRDSGTPSVARSSPAVAPTWMLATSSTVGSLTTTGATTGTTTGVTGAAAAASGPPPRSLLRAERWDEPPPLGTADPPPPPATVSDATGMLAVVSGAPTAAGLTATGFAALVVVVGVAFSASPKTLPRAVPRGFPAAVPMVAPAAAAACSVKLWATRPVDATKLPSNAVSASERMESSPCLPCYGEDQISTSLKKP